MTNARRIGSFSVSAVSLGCMSLSHAYGTPPSDEDGTKLLNHALDIGVTHLDTAALYGGGRNEALIGKAVGHRRSEYMLASKCVLGIVDGQRTLDGSPEGITRSIDASLQRLGMDHIDLMYLHRFDPKVAIEDSVGALVRAKEAGKISMLGLSEMSAETIRRAHAVHPIAAVQTEYSPVVRNPEIAVLDTCRELDITFVAFSPVSRGLLSNAVHDDAYVTGDIRANMPRFKGENLAHNLNAVRAFNALAASLELSPAQLSLAWVLARGEHIVAIPGTTNVGHLEENAVAANLTVSEDILSHIESIFRDGAIRGARYAAPMQAQVTTETFVDEELA